MRKPLRWNEKTGVQEMPELKKGDVVVVMTPAMEHIVGEWVGQTGRAITLAWPAVYMQVPVEQDGERKFQVNFVPPMLDIVSDLEGSMKNFRLEPGGILHVDKAGVNTQLQWEGYKAKLSNALTMRRLRTKIDPRELTGEGEVAVTSQSPAADLAAPQPESEVVAAASDPPAPKQRWLTPDDVQSSQAAEQPGPEAGAESAGPLAAEDNK